MEAVEEAAEVAAEAAEAEVVEVPAGFECGQVRNPVVLGIAAFAPPARAQSALVAAVAVEMEAEELESQSPPSHLSLAHCP